MKRTYILFGYILSRYLINQDKLLWLLIISCWR